MVMGLKPWEFWKMTPSEYIEYGKAYARRQKEHIDELLWVTWHTAALIRSKQMPDYKDWAKVGEQKKHQTTDEMIAQARMLNALFGGEEIIDG
jgi:chloramphenicol 3-O-phosphotransferase